MQSQSLFVEDQAPEPEPVRRPRTDHEDAIISQAMRILESRLRYRTERGSPMTSPDATRKFLRLHLAEREHEVFVGMMLDTRHRVIEVADLFTGTIDSANVYPRVVAERALAAGAAAVIVAHNHPSGNPEPSQADLAITRRLRDALGLLDIRLLDHFIVGDEVTSLAERGLV